MKISFPVLLCFLLLSSSLMEPAFSATSSNFQCLVYSAIVWILMWVYLLFGDNCKSANCSNKCSNRCAVAGVQDRCLKYCGICCEECKCVPSGTYGNKHECPCYRDKKNNKGRPKCP
ncbi:hypothetical protein ACLB2K_012168 [Fragaria x ananassa]